MSGRTAMVMAGGTGGHIFPALAVADLLKARGWSVVWLGAPGGMETTLVPKHGYPIELVTFGGLRGKGLLAKLLLPSRLLVAFGQAVAAIRRIRPHVVLGMGGYISFPGGMMAAALGKPLVVHEQNSIAGLANKVLAGVADRVLVAFPDALKRATHVGNPVRDDIGAIAAPRERFVGRGGPLRVLVVGGSLGAQALNEVVPKALALLPVAGRPVVTHQAGAKHLDTLRRNYAEANVEGELVAFIDDMAAAYADADLVVCRAGATTIAELGAAGVASVLVPFPHAVDDHQTTNAKYLSDAAAAILVPQTELTPEKLAALFLELTRQRLLDMAERARALGRRDAARAVADVCEAVAKK